MKKIILILTLVSSCITVCAATESNYLSSDYVVMTSFNVEEVAYLVHPVCTLSLASNKDKGSYNYVEGGICPAGKPTGTETCAYSAIIELNHKIIIAEQVSSGKDTAIFKNKDVTIITKKYQLTQQPWMMRVKMLNTALPSRQKAAKVQRICLGTVAFKISENP